MLTTMRITVDRFLCERPYLGQAFELRGMGLICCPCIKAELEKMEK